MRYTPIENNLFINNRKKLLNQLLPCSVVIIHSNEIIPTGNADSYYPFVQNTNLFYLSGIDQEETILILAPSHPNESLREILLIKETNHEIATWEGAKLTKTEAQKISGIKNICWNSNLDSLLLAVFSECQNIYLETNEHIRASLSIHSQNSKFIAKCQSNFPTHSYQRLFPILSKLRSVKDSIETELIKHACHITEIGFRKILKHLQPDMTEYDIEAIYISEFIRNRSNGFAYPPIIAGGKNACILHYLSNDQRLNHGELLLMDVGASYAHYNADMTRTIPINGKFTPRQRTIYNAVLTVKNRASELLKPGILIPEYHKEVGKIMEKELLKLHLIEKTDIKNQTQESPVYKKYFMHGTSHHLGLDVHDTAPLHEPVKENMVFTVEPGIYIPEENIGIRLEDDILIKKEGNVNLMKNIPIELEEIESLMKK